MMVTDWAGERSTLTYAQLGAIVLAECGPDACREGYGTVEPAAVGRAAIAYGDVNADGTLN